METLSYDGFLLQQDNATPHTSRQTTKCLNDKGINILKSPASSTDLSPIENLWGIVKNKVKKARNKIVKERKEDLVKIWNEAPFDAQVFHRIRDRMVSNATEKHQNQLYSKSFEYN